MAQRKQLTWTELRVGLFVLLAAALVVGVIFYVTGGVNVFAGKYRLRAYLPEVDGLVVGAPVRLDGLEIGNVENIVIATAKPGQSLNPRQSIQVDMRIDKKYHSYIRSDSSAGLVTEGLLGNRYVDIDRGFSGRVLENGDQIKGREENAMQQVVQRSASLLENLNGISKQASAILEDVREGKGSLGKFLVDQSAYERLNRTLGTVDQMMSNVMAGKGSLGKLVATDELYNHVDSAADRLDNVLGAVQNQQGTLGKFIYNPSFHDSAEKFLDNGNALLSGVREGKGTLGKLATDDSLFREYDQVGRNLSTATAKLNSNRTTVGKLFSNPDLYDNLTGLTGDMRLLIGDFRKNPKKFLRVKFSIF